MIVLSVGMPRSGSAWHYNLINELMQTNGYVDARVIREKYHLQSILTEVNCNIGVLSVRRLSMVTLPMLLGNSFVIKVHAGPTSTSRLLQHLGLLSITYIYRDPRDAMLSAYDFGQRALQKGRPNAFSHLTDFQKSLDFIMDYVRIWERWMNEKNVFVARYEDLLMDYHSEAKRLVRFLKLREGESEVQKVIDDHRPEAVAARKNFFVGMVGRFRGSYTAEQQAILKEYMGDHLSRMGYEI